ncbi:amidohydrolase family protein [Mycobacterium avium]|uniref:amidohydrolase family protein n=1 Tax=Mycobacterium avium TaxID=1764 RepID=UPI001CC6CB6C|nr:amidohydrolase family protein [Mycobacterium avium]MBZ4521772.1 amidohydrolase [Mycobacterium avium subsp. hominissuis]MBZ4531216.1 amidohydrolase [Mycobacterium avium subsp. hominissuis]
MAIDVHAHAVIPDYHELLTELGVGVPGYGGRHSGLRSGRPDQRITHMQEASVSRQLLSAMVAPYLPDESAAVRAARWINEAHAAMAADHPDRLAAYAALPLPHIDAALAELEYCLDTLGMIGIALHCACLDESVVAERFDPLYAELDRRGSVVFFHPSVNGLCSPLLTGWGLAATAGAVFEDTTVALHLIARRIPQRYPNITFIVPHLGGALPMLLSRLDNQLGLSTPGLPEKPSVTARRFYYDTVAHGSHAALRCAVDVFGHDRLLAGSDYPVLLPFETYAETIGYVRDAGLTEPAVRNILTANAVRVFGSWIGKD